MAVRSEVNLDSLLASRALTKEDVCKPCSEEILRKIAVTMSKWKVLLPFLSLSSENEKIIMQRSQTNSDRKIAMLLTWKENFGEDATYLQLAKAFEAAKWRNKVFDLLDLFSETEKEIRKSVQVQISVPRLGDTPKPKQLIKLVGKSGKEIFIRDTIANDWEELFMCMNFELADTAADTMEMIQANARHQVEDACREVLLMWLSGTSGRKPVTWATFVEVLKLVNHDSLAEDIKSELATDP